MQQYLMDGPMLLKLSDLVGLASIAVVLLLILIIQHARTNHYLRSIDRSLKTLPAVQHQRNLDLVQKRAV